MAKYFSLTRAAFGTDFQAALEEYYGDDVVVESASGGAITFSCPVIKNKVIKFETYSNSYRSYIGDTSASLVQVGNPYPYDGAINNYDLILSDAFIILDAVSHASGHKALIATLTNGRPIFIVGAENGTIDYRGTARGYYVDTNEFRPIRLVAPYNSGAKSKGKLCLWKSYVLNDTELELNEDDSFAYIPDLWLAPTSGSRVVGGNYYLSQGNVMGASGYGTLCYSQKYVELDV